MIIVTAVPDGLLLVQTQNLASLHRDGTHLLARDAAQLAAALQRLRNESPKKGNDTMTTTDDRPFSRPPARRPETRQASDPAARNLQPVSAQQAAAEPPADRLFAEKEISITIEVAPDGLHVRADYVGALSSIPKAIERLKAAGVLELVASSAPAPAAQEKAKAPRPTAEPIYSANGDACCTVHMKPLKDGQYGPYCSAKAKEGEAQNDKGYCALRFS